MNNTTKILLLFIILVTGGLLLESNNEPNFVKTWEVDFFDDFNYFNDENWQDQRIWVNDEKQCYLPDGELNTREVSDGTLKLRVSTLEKNMNVIIMISLEIYILKQNMLLGE